MQEEKNADADFIRRLKVKMAELGLNQKKLAIISGLSPATISGYIHSTRRPGANELMKLANALGVRMDWLMSGDQPTSIHSPLDAEWTAAIEAAPRGEERSDAMDAEWEQLLSTLSEDSFIEIATLIDDVATWPQLIGGVMAESHRRLIAAQKQKNLNNPS